MLNVGKISEGFVLDHIEAGTSLSIYHDLKLDQFDRTVAIIKNARSNKMGKKDIIKVDKDEYDINLDVIGYIDPGVTVSIIKDGVTIEKKKVDLPKRLVNIKKCKNPRCITAIEPNIPHIFNLTDEEKRIYRCEYCESK